MIERYQTKQMQQIWSDDNKFAKFLVIELASLEAQASLKIIPQEAYQSIASKATFEVAKIKELEAITKHDVIAFTKAVELSLGEEKQWFHYGLTSTDVVDSAQALVLRDASAILLQDLASFLSVLKQKALIYKNTPCMGRTHGMHAQVTSFGLKWLLWYDELNRNMERFKRAIQDVEVIKLSGAVGNYADIDPRVEQLVAKKIGFLAAAISTQVLSRDRHAYYVMSLALMASTLEKIATEIRSLSRSEIKEVEENFATGQKGSSAMPHKRNPITSENICGCARIMRSYVNVALENNNLWHERDISHSSAERIILADATTLLDYMLRRYQKVLDQLVVFEDNMLENIQITKGITFSNYVLKALIQKGLSRGAAYDMIQKVSFLTMESSHTFLEVALQSEINQYLTEAELRSCFDIEKALCCVDEIYKRFIE